MKIKTLLLLSSVSLAAFSALIGATVYLAVRQIDGYAAQGDQAAVLINDVFELNVLGQAYVARREERPRTQWYAQFSRLEKDVAAPVFAAEPGRGLVAVLGADMEGIKRSFGGLVDADPAAGADPALVKMLSDDVLVKMQQLMTDTRALSDRALQAREKVRTGVVRIIFSLLALLLAVAAGVIYLLYRRIIVPVVGLQKGAEIIGKGDLGHRVGFKGNDEIGLLSRAFDAMAGKLKKAHDGLERRIKERTRELEELSRQNETLLESIGDGVVAIDTQWNIIHWNAAATRITGWTKGEAMGRPFRDVIRFIRERDRSENVLFISDAMLSKEVRFMEDHTLLVRKDGSDLPVGDSAAPIVGVGKKVTGAIVVFRDASPERDARLIRSSFAYASHQLRTPVTEALWGLEAALEEKEVEAMKEKVKVAYGSVRSVHKLVTEIVEVSEIDQRTVLPKREPTAVKAVLSAVAEKAGAKAADRGVTLTTGTATDAQISTDAKMLARALQEIVDNAIEYGRRGGTVTVSAAAHGRDMVFEIVDDGIGIPAAQQSLIFTKFFRGQNIPPESVGAGLGLYVCGEYAKLLGGKAWFKSEEGKGTTFFVAVPIGDR